MKMKLDAQQKAAVGKELRLDAAFAELDAASMMEVSGGIAVGGCIVLPPFFPDPKPPMTTMAIGEEDGGPIYTTLAIGEEDGGGQI